MTSTTTPPVIVVGEGRPASAAISSEPAGGKPRILVADPIAEAGVEVLRREADVTVQTGLAPDRLLELVADYDALVVRSETKVTSKVLDAARTKNQEKTSEATNDLADACASCHEVYRDKGPADSPLRCTPPKR